MNVRVTWSLIQVLLFLCFSPSLLKGQVPQNTFNFQAVKLRDSELSSKEIMCLLQDSRGFIWVGTKAGVNVFDGYSYKIFKQESKNKLSLGGDYIKAILEDNTNNIVINTNNSVDVYYPRTGQFSHVRLIIGESIIQDSTFAIHAFQSSDKTIYFTSRDELYLYDPEKELATEINLLRKINYDAQVFGEFIHFAEDPSGTIWIPFNKQIAGYNNAKKSSHYINLENDTSLHGDRITNLYSLSVNKLGIFTTDHHYIYDVTTGELVEEICYNLPYSIAGYNELFMLHQDENNVVWFTSTLESRLILFDPATQTFTDQLIVNEKGQSYGQIRSIFQDRQKIWWMGTPNDGLFFSYANNINTFKHILSNTDSPGSLNHISIRAITKSMDGNLWIGTDGGGLNMYDPYSSTTKFYQHNPEDTSSIASNSVLTLFKDSYGRILLGGYNTGLAVYNYAKDNFRSFLPDASDPSSLSHHDVRSIAEIGDGQYLIALNGGNGLELFDINSQKIIHYTFDPNSPGGDIVSHWLLVVYRDPNGEIWLGGYDGLGKFDPVSGKSQNYFAYEDDTTSLSNSWVYCILRDSDGILWVGTSYGLNKLDEKKQTFTHYFEADGLPNNIICGLAEDAQKNLWISTNKGISRLNKETMEFSNYDASDGLKVEQFIQGAYFQDDEGNIYFGGNGGLVIIDPENFRKNEYVPPLYFTDFQLSYRSVEIGKKGSPLKQHIAFTDRIVLNYKQNMITFNYVALNYMSPAKNQYECMMEGLDEDWQKMGARREATYTNLSPGRYSFRVRGSNNDGIWNTEGVEVEVIITPPWWKTWWFRIIILSIIGYLIYGVIRMRTEAVKRDKTILKNKIEEGDKELQRQRDEIEQQKKEILAKEESAKEINWYNEGMTHLSEIITRNNNDLNTMAGKLMSGLIDYLDASIGALYVLNESEGQDIKFELLGSYALDKERLKKYFSTEEGYLGACYKEKKKIILDNLPENYASMGSGLGKISLNHLIMVPLLLEGKLNGVIELASLKKIPEYKLNLLEKLAENLASAIEIVKVNNQMRLVVERLNSHAEELNAQKEEMYQNMEEMQATQEEMERIRKKDKDQEQVLREQNEKLMQSESELKSLKKKYNDLQKKYEKLKKT